MASFTEKATLEVKDKSTAQIKKINAELKRLQKTTNSLKNIRISIPGLPRTTAQVRSLTSALMALKRASSSLNIRVGTQGLTQAQRQLSSLRNSARNPINVRMNYGGQPPRPPRPPGPPGQNPGGRNPRRGRSIVGTAFQGFNAGLGGGLGFGLMGGLATINPALLALAAASYAAAAALRYIGNQAYKSDRADLMMRMAATAGQQPIIQAAVDKYAGTSHAMGMSKADMKMFITGILGDVGGKTAEERATAAAAVAPIIADKFLPLAYALGGPDVNKESIIKDLAVIVKGLNIASGNLTNSRGEFTEDGKRVFEGVALAKAMNPLLDSERIRTTLANLKTLAFTMAPESLATLLSSSGDRGVRVANELYQATRSMSGTVDNKALNKALSQLGLLTGGKPLPGKAGKAGGIQTGTGTPVDSEGLRRDPFKWILENVLPRVENTTFASLTKVEKKRLKEAEARARAEGKTAEEIEAAGKPGRAKFQSVMDQMFPGMPASSRTGLADAIYSADQNKSQIAQGKDILTQDVNQVFAKSWTAQLENLRTTLADKAQTLGDETAKALGVNEKIKAIDNALKTGKFLQQETAMGQAKEVLDIITTPQRLAGELLVKGAGLLVDAGIALLKKMGILSDDDAKKMKGELYKAPEMPRVDIIKGMIANSEIKIQKQIDALKEAERRNQPRVASRLQKEITTGRAEITTLNANVGQFTIPKNWGIDNPNMFPITPKKHWRQKSIFPDADRAPTPAADLERMFQGIQTSTQSWVGAITQTPSEFDKVFGTLGQTGLNAGTGFGDNATSTIKTGSSAAGTMWGESAIAALRTGIAGLNLNLNVNNNTGTKPADPGPRVND